MVKLPVGDLCTSEDGADDTPSAAHIHAGCPPLFPSFCQRPIFPCKIYLAATWSAAARWGVEV